MSTLVLCSGGLDSVTLAYKVHAEGNLSYLLSFDYGQRHKKELNFAEKASSALGVPHEIIDISNLTKILGSSALTDSTPVPDGHYAEQSMMTTVVPNRNPIMLTIAFALAARENLQTVAAAVHAGDHFIYPDCRPEVVDAFREMQLLALDGVSKIDLYAPFVGSSKADIVSVGSELDVPFQETWSCYKGLERHCGRCGTCVERLEAFHLAGIDDPTSYDDTEFWKTA